MNTKLPLGLLLADVWVVVVVVGLLLLQLLVIIDGFVMILVGQGGVDQGGTYICLG